jgi:enoyl-CoA hydratase/carnithine racemase
MTVSNGRVAVITFGDAPVNSLGHSTRRDLAAAIDAAVADPIIAAIRAHGRKWAFLGRR